jgi:hypothetical protein
MSIGPVSDPLVQGDKLARPVNAPAAAPLGTGGVQPGVTGQVVTANRVIIFGTNGELLVYSGTPEFGNLLASISGIDTADQFGNFISAGVVVYGPNGSAVQMYLGSSFNAMAAALFMIPPGTATMVNPPQLFGEAVHPGAVNEVVVAVLDSGSETDGANAAVQVFSDAADGSTSASVVLEINGTRVMIAFATELQNLVPVFGTTPGGSGGETWHPATPLSGTWAGSGSGVNGLFYQVSPDNRFVDVIGDLVNATATGNSTVFTLPAGYRPATAVNLQAGWNNPAASNSASPPWLNISTGGVMQLTGIEVADKEIFFSVRFPLGSL